MHQHEIGKGFEALKVSESPDIICDSMWPHRECASKDRPTIKKEVLEVGETLAPQFYDKISKQQGVEYHQHIIL